MPFQKTRFPVNWRLFIKKSKPTTGNYLEMFAFWLFHFCLVFGSLQTRRLCIMGDIAGGGSVAVSVGWP